MRSQIYRIHGHIRTCGGVEKSVQIHEKDPRSSSSSRFTLKTKIWNKLISNEFHVRTSRPAFARACLIVNINSSRGNAHVWSGLEATFPALLHGRIELLALFRGHRSIINPLCSAPALPGYISSPFLTYIMGGAPCAVLSVGDRAGRNRGKNLTRWCETQQKI